MEQKPIKVLCVDDNFLVCEALRVRLEMAGYEWAGGLPSADDLISQVQQHSPDVVVLDIDMPGRDPFEALAELSSVSPQTRTVVYTGHLRPELVDRAFEAGAWGYIVKSAEVQNVVDAIAKVASGGVVLDPAAGLEQANG